MGLSLSSERRGGKPLVEDCLVLDLARVMRLGPVRDGMAGHGALSWTVDGETLGSAALRIDLRSPDKAQLVIAYAQAGTGDRARRVIVQRIRLAFTVPQFGGRRWWLLCPVTGARVRCLYRPAGADRFASRAALGLSYRVERLGRFDRTFEKLFRAQRRLGASPCWGAEIERPKGMWRSSFDDRLHRLAARDAECGAAVLAVTGLSRAATGAGFSKGDPSGIR